MSNFAPRKWTREELNLIENAPELYWVVYNLLHELKRGNGSNPEYIEQAVPQMEDLLTRINGRGEKLKPCPFCGGSAQLLSGYSGSSNIWYICCTSCHNESRRNENQETVISAWNRRANEE